MFVKFGISQNSETHGCTWIRTSLISALSYLLQDLHILIDESSQISISSSPRQRLCVGSLHWLISAGGHTRISLISLVTVLASQWKLSSTCIVGTVCSCASSNNYHHLVVCTGCPVHTLQVFSTLSLRVLVGPVHELHPLTTCNSAIALYFIISWIAFSQWVRLACNLTSMSLSIID